MQVLDYLPIVIPSLALVIPSVLVVFVRSVRTAIYIGVAALTVSLLSSAWGFLEGIGGITLFSSQVYVDTVYYVISIIADLTGILTLFAVSGEIRSWPTGTSFVSLTLLTVLGIHYLSASTSVPMVLMGWGIASAAVYTLAMLSKDTLSAVTGIKYLIMGIVSSSFMILGLAYYVAFTGTLSFIGVQVTVPTVFAVVLLSVAAMFKLGVFPFHTWMPDLYSKGDRAGVIAVAGLGKVVGVAVLLRVLTLLDPSPLLTNTEVLLFSVMGIATLTFGNVMAFGRKELSELLAYSSVSQAGYFLLAFAMLEVSKTAALVGLAFQTLAYSIAQVGLFSGVSYIERASGSAEYSSLRGLASGDKAAAFSLIVLLLSLLGMPPILGFWAKLYIFEATFAFPIVTVLGLINSAASAGYYIQPMRDLFGEGKWSPAESPERTILIASAVVSIILGILAPLVLVGVSF